MGLFSRLFGDRFTQSPPDEPRLSDAAIMRELYPFGAQLKTFTHALLARLPEKERARLVRRVSRYYNLGEDPATALASGLLDAEKGKLLNNLVLMAVDGKRPAIGTIEMAHGCCSDQFLIEIINIHPNTSTCPREDRFPVSGAPTITTTDRPQGFLTPNIR